MRKISSLVKVGAVALLLTSLTSCEDVLEQYFPKPSPPPTTPTFPSLGLDIPFYTLAGGTKLDAYSTKDPAMRTSSVAITGLQSGETLLAIDFRPATGQLYGISSASRLYVINQNTGAARAVGAGSFTPALGGNLVGFDFNPTVDRIRVVTSTGQNLRLNPETGAAAATDGVLNGAAGTTITGAAYTNNTTKAATTILYDLDPATDQLYRQEPPNDGTLVAVGSLSLNITGDGGFDIDAKTGTALGLCAVNGNPTLFTVDLTTGAARPLAQYAASLGYSGIAIPTQPVMYAVGFITITGRSAVNYLYIFDPTQASESTTTGIGLARNEEIKGLDFHPATGQLYALVIGSGGRFLDGTIFSDSKRLYTIDLITGAATRVADLGIALPFSERYSFDFDPVTDRIRIATANRQNLLVDPTDGTVTVEGNLTAAVGSLAYSNSYAGATSTTLYAISNNKLYLQNPPSAGTLTEVGTIGLSGFSTPATVNLFDIGGTTNTAYGFTVGSNNKNIVSSLDLTTHTATYLRNLDLAGGPFVYAVAVAPGF